MKKPALGHFGEKLVKRPQDGNETGIFKEHTHKVTKWLKCQGHDR